MNSIEKSLLPRALIMLSCASPGMPTQGLRFLFRSAVVLRMEVLSTQLANHTLVHRGKVRDVYAINNMLLLVATDRVSAFDVVMNEGVPKKGELLTRMSAFWFNATAHIVPNHVVSTDVNNVEGLSEAERAMLDGRSTLVRRTTPLPIECVVRGYLAGSGWKEYTHHGTVCGIPLERGLIESARLSQPLFTPATKAQEGHDLNIPFEQAAELVGSTIANDVRRISLELYTFAAAHAAARGLILADTKFEFGVTDDQELILIDEALTPDSSRYWLAETFREGGEQINFDKQLLRDYLDRSAWNKMPPPPSIPQEILDGTLKKYIMAYERITGDRW
jgi:phosphoribosylaminoimidazole-succinocarboxamide synthase